MDKLFKNIVIEVSFDEELYDQLKTLRNNSQLKEADKVHLVHVFNSKGDEKFPMGIDDRDKMINYMNEKLCDLKDDLLPEGANENKWYTQVLLHSDTKLETLRFLEEVDADLVVTATRGNNASPVVNNDSFSSYLVRHAPCDVFVIRPIHDVT